MIIFPLKLYTRVLLCTRMSVGVESQRAGDPAGDPAGKFDC